MTDATNDLEDACLPKVDADIICITKDGRRIKLSKIGDSHLINRIKYFKRKLTNMPTEAIYIGDSVYAEDAVEAENAYNEALAEGITLHIREMEKELKRREQ